MSDKKIIIQGKEIDYGDMSEEKLTKLYSSLLDRYATLQEKIESLISAEQLAEIDINEIVL